MFFGLKGRQSQFKPVHNKAIVTLLIGDEYLQIWRTLSMNSWLSYADKFGFDVIAILSPLDESDRGKSRSPAWQKLLILDQAWSQHYDRIVWMDSDIVISNSAPDIIDSAPDREKIGVCTDVQLSVVDRHVYHERLRNMEMRPAEQMEQHFRYCTNMHNHLVNGAVWQEEFNTGVMVFAPDRHNGLLTGLYYDGKVSTSPRHEQPFLSALINHRKLASFLSKRFNMEVNPIIVLSQFSQGPITEQIMPVFLDFLRNELKKSYFLHFAGSMNLMKMLAGHSANGTNVLTDNI